MSGRNGSGIPDEAVPEATGATDFGGAALGPTDWFLLSRVDGRTSVKALRQVSGLAAVDFDASLKRLVEAGLLGGVGVTAKAPPPPTPEPERPPERAPQQSGASRVVGPGRPKREVAESTVLSAAVLPPGWPTPFAQFHAAQVDLQDGAALTTEQKRVILYFHRHLRAVTYYQLLGLATDAGPDEVRSAYFRFSKIFHPDRWFRKDIGAYEHRLVEVFKWLNRAYMVLSAPKKRRGYDRLLSHGYVGEWQIDDPSVRTTREPAADVPAHAPGPTDAGSGRGAPSAGPQRPAGVTESVAPGAGRAERPADAGRAVGTLLMRARKASQDGDWSAAADAYTRAVQLQPSRELRILAVECMLKAGAHPAEIDREIVLAGEGAEPDVRLLTLEAEVARRLGETERAVKSYRAVLALEPANPVARLGLERLGAPTEDE